MLILEHRDVVRLLPMKECIPIMAETLAALSRGEAEQPPRSFFDVPGGAGSVGLMPAFVPGAVGAKVISAFHGSDDHPAHDGAVLLFDSTNGRLRAVVDAIAVTAIRTAAISAVATDLLARSSAGDLAILGSGVQARSHLEAMLLVRELSRVRVWSRTDENARLFAEWESERAGLEIEAMPSARDAVQGADIICTCTASEQPVLFGEWVASGAHVNAIGAYTPTTREVDTALVSRAAFYVDSRESAQLQAGDWMLAAREAGLDAEHIRAEIGEVVTGTKPGRGSNEEITLFKSLGLGVEDIAAAAFVAAKAEAESK